MVEKISTIADTQSPPSIIDTDGPNFHSFVAIEDTWIYDITCPPYKAADEHEIYYSDASERDIYTTQEISNSDSTMGLCILLDMADPKSAGTATHYPTSNDSCIPLNKSIITWISHDSDSSFQPRPQAFMQYANQHVQKSRNHKPSKGNLALDK